MNLSAWLRPLLGAAVVAVAALALLSPGSAPRTARAAVNCDVADLGIDAEEQAFVGLLNQYRAQNGAGPVSISQTLNRAASWMSVDMATNDYLSHTDKLGRDPYQRMDNCDVAAAQGRAENVAAGYTTAQEAFDGWQSSPGHNANMLNGSYRSIGISRVFNANAQYGWYWTNKFSTELIAAAPPVNAPCSAPAINVNPSTNTGTVGMAFTVTGGATCGAAPHFQFWVGKVNSPNVPLLDSSIPWVPMQLYSANNSFTWVPNAPGYYYVTFWVKNSTTTPANTWFDTATHLNLMTIN